MENHATEQPTTYTQHKEKLSKFFTPHLLNRTEEEVEYYICGELLLVNENPTEDPIILSSIDNNFFRESIQDIYNVINDLGTSSLFKAEARCAYLHYIKALIEEQTDERRYENGINTKSYILEWVNQTEAEVQKVIQEYRSSKQ